MTYTPKGPLPSFIYTLKVENTHTAAPCCMHSPVLYKKDYESDASKKTLLKSDFLVAQKREKKLTLNPRDKVDSWRVIGRCGRPG